MTPKTSDSFLVDELIAAWTDRRIDRRQLMQGILATGGAAGLAAALPRLVQGQAATPVATPGTAGGEAGYDGPLADVQVIRLPLREPVTMDPGVSYGDAELAIFTNIFEGLTGIDQATGEVVPRIAESWVANEDASEFTFTLRPAVTWSDGKPITSEDFVYSWQRVLDPATQSQYIPVIFPLKNAEGIAGGDADLATLGVEAVDDVTLRVTLERPMPYFPLLATIWTFAPVPRHVVDSVGLLWTDPANIVTSGPYMLTEWTHDQSIVLELNGAYYGEKPMLTRAEYRLFQDPATEAYPAFEIGEVDCVELEGTTLDRALADPAAAEQIVSVVRSNCYFVVCDTTSEPTDAIEFRQALSKAIDRTKLTKTILRDQFVPASTLLPPDIEGHNPDVAIPEDPTNARTLLEEAGIDPAGITLDIAYLTSEPRYKTVAQYLQSSWRGALGIQVTLTPLEAASYNDWRASLDIHPFGTYTATWRSDYGDPSNWHNENFASEADHYRTHWQNDEFDSLVAAAAVNTDPAERAQQYQDAEAIIIKEAPVIPLYRGKAYRAVKPWVKNIYLQPILSYVDLRNVRIAPQ